MAQNKMNNTQKKQVFQAVQARSERDKIVNTGVNVPFGTTNVILKALDWDASNDFEDRLIKAAKKLNFDVPDATDLQSLDLAGFISNVSIILRRDLVDLAEISTGKTVNLQFIKDNKATKNDLIGLIIKAFEVNYGYLKNLLTLTKGLK